jgi:hypothetical protein
MKQLCLKRLRTCEPARLVFHLAAGLVPHGRPFCGRRRAAHALRQPIVASCSPGSSPLQHWRLQTPACRAGRKGSAAAAAGAGTAVSSSSALATAVVSGSSEEWPTAPPEYQHLTYLQVGGQLGDNARAAVHGVSSITTAGIRLYPAGTIRHQA